MWCGFLWSGACRSAPCWGCQSCAVLSEQGHDAALDRVGEAGEEAIDQRTGGKAGFEIGEAIKLPGQCEKLGCDAAGFMWAEGPHRTVPLFRAPNGGDALGSLASSRDAARPPLDRK